MFEAIDIMLTEAKKSLDILKAEYQRNLAAHEVSITLRNNVRRLLGDLRDPLDHIYQLIPGVSVSEAFPVSNSAAQFTHQTANLAPNIIAVIRQFQSFDDGNVWLERFSALSNIHKHLELVPQVRIETPSLTLSGGRASMSIIGSASMSIGRNCRISLGGVPIASGQTLSAHSPTILAGPELRVRREIWVNFLFDPQNEHLVRKLGLNTSIAVLPFLEESLNKVEEIVTRLKPIIETLIAPTVVP